MAKELSDELIKDWQYLMSGFKNIAKKVPVWEVKVKEDMHITINKKWDIICHFINWEYVEVKLKLNGDEIMTLKHTGKNYHHTVATVLDYINRYK